MMGGRATSFDGTGADGRGTSRATLALMFAVAAVIAVIYHVSGVAGDRSASESGFALSTLIPLLTLHRRGVFAFGRLPS